MPTPKAITKAQCDHIHANRKTSLAKQKQIEKQKQFAKDFNSPTCIICLSNAAESPLHLLCECPTTQSIASIACDTVIIQNINQMRTNIIRPKEKNKSQSPLSFRSGTTNRTSTASG
jgi:hypothetical protein